MQIGGASLAVARDFAYALCFNPDEPDYLVQFNVDDDVICNEIKLPDNSGFNNFIIDETGGCYITVPMLRDIYHYDNLNLKIEHFKFLWDIYGPRQMALTEKYLIVAVEGNNKTNRSGIIMIDRQSRKIVSKTFIDEDNPAHRQTDIASIFFDGTKYLFITTFSMNDPQYGGDVVMDYSGNGGLFVFDIDKKMIVKTIDIPREYSSLYGLCNIGDKIYISSLSKGKMDIRGNKDSNTDILIYSFSTGKLIKKIQVSGHPSFLTYDKSVNKIYVQHMDDDIPRNLVEVIDTINDKVIKSLYLPSQLMLSIVKPGKLYVSLGGAFLRQAHTSPCLLAIDTKTDKIIKKFEGVYQGISVNPKY